MNIFAWQMFSTLNQERFFLFKLKKSTWHTVWREFVSILIFKTRKNSKEKQNILKITLDVAICPSSPVDAAKKNKQPKN